MRSASSGSRIRSSASDFFGGVSEPAPASNRFVTSLTSFVAWNRVSRPLSTRYFAIASGVIFFPLTRATLRRRSSMSAVSSRPCCSKRSMNCSIIIPPFPRILRQDRSQIDRHPFGSTAPLAQSDRHVKRYSFLVPRSPLTAVTHQVSRSSSEPRPQTNTSNHPAAATSVATRSPPPSSIGSAPSPPDSPHPWQPPPLHG